MGAAMIIQVSSKTPWKHAPLRQVTANQRRAYKFINQSQSATQNFQEGYTEGKNSCTAWNKVEWRESYKDDIAQMLEFVFKCW